MTAGQRSTVAMTRSAYGSRCATSASARAATRNPVRASPSRTALATIPRTERITIAAEAMVTRTPVSTTRSTTTVPRTLARETPVRSPRWWLRTSSPRRAGRMLLAR